MNKKELAVAALDLGASGGKCLLGGYDGRRLRVTEAARFPFGASYLQGWYYYDVMHVYDRMLDGLIQAAALSEGRLCSFGVTSFGNTPVLFDKNGRLFTPVYAAAGGRMAGAAEEVLARIPARMLHERTGTDIQSYQTLMQLYAYRMHGEGRLLEEAGDILLLPAALSCLLCGERANERTGASITGLYNRRTKDWDPEIMRLAGLPHRLAPVADPCTVLGKASTDIRRITRLDGLRIVNTAQHDTASAVLALPAAEENACFLSVGTFALLGFETQSPSVNDDTFAAGIGNEANPFGRYKTLLSFRCMWYLERCREYYGRTGRRYGYDELSALAAAAPPMRYFIPLGDMAFFSDAFSVPERIAEYCRTSGQGTPEGPGGIVRCIFDSAAWEVRRGLAALKKAAGLSSGRIYVLGGGVRDVFLMQDIADCCGVPLVAGRYEAASMGALAAQLAALGELGSLAEVRALVAASVETREYFPGAEPDLSRAARFLPDGAVGATKEGIRC